MLERQSRNDLRVELREVPESLSEAWDHLADTLAAPPFLRPGWIVAWTRAFGSGDLLALTAMRESRLVGLLPFIERRGIRAAPANWHTPLFGFLAEDQEASAALAQGFILKARVRADLPFLDADDPNLFELRAAAESLGRSVIVRVVMRSPYVRLAETDWESYRASLHRKFRKDVDRRKRRIEEHGSLSVEMADGNADLESMLDEGFVLEAAGWKHGQGSAIVSSEATRRFYSEVARWARTRGWLRMAFLRLDGKPIAFDLCLESGRVTYVLKGGFDPAFGRFGPGTLLTHESLRCAFDRELISYEFLGDADPYKLSWTQTCREVVRFQAFSRSPAGRVNHLAWSHGRSAVRRAIALAARSKAGR